MTSPSSTFLVDPIETTEQTAPSNIRPRRERSTPVRHNIQPIAHGWYANCKRLIDLGLAVLLAIPVIPVVLITAVLVKLTSRGPAFYTQTRVGLNGKLFTIFKLRTMIHNCESLTGARWSLPGDPRITPLGWLLRVSHLDELPQLLNVLRGDMSLIGPRPERPEFIPELERALPAYRQRLNVRPGVTGLAQVQLPPDTDIDSVRRKLAHDLYYIRHLSPWMDFRLLLCTALYALAIPFRLSKVIFCLPRSRDIERSMRDVVTDSSILRNKRASA